MMILTDTKSYIFIMLTFVLESFDFCSSSSFSGAVVPFLVTLQTLLFRGKILMLNLLPKDSEVEATIL